MKMIDSKNLNINDIPLKYHLDSFNQFALSFDPQNDSAMPYFIHIPISQPLSNLDHVSVYTGTVIFNTANIK